MDREEYQLFEHLPDGSLNWFGIVYGSQRAKASVWALSEKTGNECFAMDCTGSEIVLARTPTRDAKRIFQIAYGKSLAVRAHTLRDAGYDVTSVCGNQVARFVLSACASYDLFVIGHAAADPVRLEMVRWLRARYPNTRIVALNFPGRALDGLRYNALREPAGSWLPLISTATGACVDAGSLSRIAD